MASQKHVAEVPRSILPRLTWNGSSRPTVTPSHPPTLATRRPQPPQGWSPLSRQIHSLSTPYQPSRVASASGRDFHYASPARRTSISSTTARPSVESPSNPIRYNGVYVAVFKTAQRAFHATPARPRDHHFDTLKFVKRLQAEGFSEEQAVAMMRVLNDIIQESIQNLTRTMVLREDSERSTYTQKVDFAKLRSELLNADSTEAQLTRSSHEKIAADLAKLNSRLRDEIGRTQASVRLDLNLEKGRIREEANGQEMRIKETETRIEQEVAGLRERVEAVKFSTLQWLMGVCTGTAALILGAWRLFM
ncbi:hypothetical protein NUU61_008928 [Penicillium alfredii]|uniref:DUF1640 domain-containing protein n=1 Tax=Penicillium alfredii TaxID=1506179 RepID=A0A9W9EMD0_9EURO|nr:uncharacterized protein NUU61_008928 [Penicillium alfredii]KAJ5084349.1 hypothetical protein NUU61_008928 [Penicillium alfredii]